MDAGKSGMLCWILLFVFFPLPTSAEQKTITAESGQNITLPCQAPNNNILVVEWSRADLESEYVLLYRDEQLAPEEQHSSFKDRVDLQDRQMKDGDVSVILKNVTINDTGIYECRVVLGDKNRRSRAHLKTDPISIIYLSVDPPGPSGGHYGLIASLLVVPGLFIAGFLWYKKHQHPERPYQLPPDELHPV